MQGGEPRRTSSNGLDGSWMDGYFWKGYLHGWFRSGLRSECVEQLSGFVVLTHQT